MKCLVSILLLFTLILGVFSAKFFEYQPTIKGHEEECYDKKNKKYYEVGKEMEMDECGQKLCKKFGKRILVEYNTCGTMSHPKECKKVVDLTLPYPKCCGQIICPTKKK